MADFEKLGATVVGISFDPLETLKRFQAQEHAPQRFVSDPSGAAAHAFDVSMTQQGQTFAKRVTFVIKDGKVLFSVFDWSPLGNVNKTLDWLKAHPQTAALEKPPMVGAPAPAIALPIIANGSGSFELARERGRGVYVSFFASWCDPCKEEAKDIEDAARASAPDIVVVGIAVLDLKSDALDFVRAHALTYPIAIDETGAVGAAYRLVQLPLHVFVGPDGIIRQYVVGGPLSMQEIQAGLRSIAR